jgi:cytochrome c oxidase subunit 2
MAASLYNLPRGVTPISHEIYGLNLMAFWIMCAIAVVVFGAITWSMIFHRRSRHPKPATFQENTVLEVVWTVIPFIILLVMAVPAARVLLHAEDVHHSEMTVEVTGYQWLWRYTYPRWHINIYSRLADSSLRIAPLDSGLSPYSVPHYLHSVTQPLVLPVGEKVRLLITSRDVIHSWWVPDLGVQMDANPGLVNSIWVRILKPGTYRGQCNQICGWGHAYMPIVVVAKPKTQFMAWVREWQARHGGAAGHAASPAPQGS